MGLLLCLCQIFKIALVALLILPPLDISELMLIVMVLFIPDLDRTVTLRTFVSLSMYLATLRMPFCMDYKFISVYISQRTLVLVTLKDLVDIVPALIAIRLLCVLRRDINLRLAPDNGHKPAQRRYHVLLKFAFSIPPLSQHRHLLLH